MCIRDSLNGGYARICTSDTKIFSLVLYYLSYIAILVGEARLELARFFTSTGF